VTPKLSSLAPQSRDNLIGAIWCIFDIIPKVRLLSVGASEIKRLKWMTKNGGLLPLIRNKQKQLLLFQNEREKAIQQTI
jgi:hypothetical protein